MCGRSRTANGTDANERSATFLRPGDGLLQMETDSHRGRQAGADRAKKTVDNVKGVHRWERAI